MTQTSPIWRDAPMRRADMPRLVVIIGIGGVVAPLLLMCGLARAQH